MAGAGRRERDLRRRRHARFRPRSERRRRLHPRVELAPPPRHRRPRPPALLGGRLCRSQGVGRPAAQARAGGVAARGGGCEPPRPHGARLARAHRRHARMGGALLLRLLPARRGRQRAAAAGEFAAAGAALGLLAAHCGGGDRLTGGHGKTVRGVFLGPAGVVLSCPGYERRRCATKYVEAIPASNSTVLFCLYGFVLSSVCLSVLDCPRV
mmetsp:Transcript_2665/g.8109  ORF Transcript_2665/g.8109 Transcript_2665/m.8109 type:complete len:211 (+) Transcript_2665:511-1143(+)